jgi:hypothetical protein
MNQRERIAIQRALASEAIGKLVAITQYFGVEDETNLEDGEHLRKAAMKDHEEWEAKMKEFIEWIWDESPIA